MLLTFSMSVLAMLVSDPTPMKIHQKAKSTHFVSRLWWVYLVSPLDFELHSVNSTSNTRELKVTVEIIGLNHACGKRTCLLTTIVQIYSAASCFEISRERRILSSTKVTYVILDGPFPCVCVCMYVCMWHVCMWHVCMYVCMYVYMYVCNYVCMYVCIYVCM